MKTVGKVGGLLTAILLGSIISTSLRASGPDVFPNYFVVKIQKFNQTDTTGPSSSGVNNPFRLDSFVEARIPGSVTATTVQTPLPPSPPSPGGIINGINTADGLGTFEGMQKYPALSSLNTNYPDGSYHLAVTGSAASYTSNMLLNNGSFSTHLVNLASTHWSSGALQYFASEGTAGIGLTWAALADAGVNDALLLVVQTSTGLAVQYILMPATNTSQTLPTLTTGSYGLSLDYLKTSATDTTSITGATGYAGYVNQTSFVIVVNPDPVITDFQIISGVPTITFTSVAGRSFAAERKDNLNDATWTTVTNAGNIAGNGNPVTTTDPDANLATLHHRFYHVAALP